MAIAQLSPTAPVAPVPQMPVAVSENFKGTTYDNNQVPVVSLLSYVEGSPWQVKSYFRQVLGQHNDLKEIDPGLSPEFQSYHRINQLELRMQDELSSSTDNDTQRTTVTGAALVYGFIQPNVNDYFIANTSYRRDSLFRVTNVDRLTWRRESVFGIQFQLVDYTDNLTNELADFKRKTTEEYFFDRERLMEGLIPYLKTEDYKLVHDLRDARQRLGSYYVNTFAVTSSHTLVIPGQSNRIYDSFLIDFIMMTMGFTEFPRLLHVKQLPKSGDPYLEQPQFWQAIVERDPNHIEFGNKQMGIVSTSGFFANSYIKTMYSARMDNVVYPINPDESAHSGDELCKVASFCGAIKPTTAAQGKTTDYSTMSFTLATGDTVAAYPKVLQDDYYVLSEAFYEKQDSRLTLLEIMVRDYLESKTLDRKQLSFMISIYPKMERLEQFYYGPLLLCLMRYADQLVY